MLKARLNISLALSILRMIKLFAWEPFMINRLTELRENELAQYRKGKFLDMAMYVATDMLPLMGKIMTFTCYVSLL